MTLNVLIFTDICGKVKICRRAVFTVVYISHAHTHVNAVCVCVFERVFEHVYPRIPSDFSLSHQKPFERGHRPRQTAASLIKRIQGRRPTGDRPSPY